MTDSPMIDMPAEERRGFRLTLRLMFGIGLLGVGLMWTLDNLGVADATQVVAWWPMLAIVYGLAKITGWAAWRRPFAGLVWLVAGTWMLLHNLGYIRPGIEALWPVLLVLLGIRILTGRTRWVYRVGRRSRVTEMEGSDVVKCDVVMASVQRRIVVQGLRRVELNAVMGNIEADFRGATLADHSAIVEAACVMGGIEIIVPDTWRVVNESTSALGSVEDHTHPPVAADAPTLIVRGSAVMGSIEFRH